jgi:DNA primase
LTESIIDAATLQLKGGEKLKEYQVLACYGTNGLTEEHRESIKEWLSMPTYAKASLDKEIILFFDGDEAGKARHQTQC